MFLSRLNEKEKKIFLEFAMKIQMADGKTVPEEEKMIKEYCNEMKISFEEKDEITENEIIDFLNNSSLESKKIIIFEGIGLAYADGDYCGAEKEVIDTIASGIGLDGDMVATLEDYILKYNGLVNEIYFMMTETGE